MSPKRPVSACVCVSLPMFHARSSYSVVGTLFCLALSCTFLLPKIALANGHSKGLLSLISWDASKKICTHQLAGIAATTRGRTRSWEWRPPRMCSAVTGEPAISKPRCCSASFLNLHGRKFITNSEEKGTKYHQLRQNYLNNDFQANVGKELPKQFPEPLSVGKLDVGKLAVPHTALCKPEVA